LTLEWYPIIGWLLFGGEKPSLEQQYVKGELKVNNEGFFSVLVALSSYRLSEIIEKMADKIQAYRVKRGYNQRNPFLKIPICVLQIFVL
jgi:hypothetical protein